MTSAFTEAVVEDAALEWLRAIGWSLRHGLHIAPGKPGAERAVADGATVPIYYESRPAKRALDEAERPEINPKFEEDTEGEEVERNEVG